MAKSAKSATNTPIKLDSTLNPAEESIFGAAVVVAVVLPAGAAVVAFVAADAAVVVGVGVVVVLLAGALVVVVFVLFEAVAMIATYANIVITKSNLFMFNLVVLKFYGIDISMT